MKNFVFISPNFPTNYWKFCAELKRNGMNVLGIGDCPYDQLMPELKASLNEYYKVSSLENYDEVFRAVAFLTYKHGKIDWLESNNEYWLERDAALRTAFNIETGFKTPDMEAVKYKSAMKAYYAKAGIKTARWHLVRDYTGCKDFIAEVGYPVIVKPDVGVGACDTYKLSSDTDLTAFFEKLPAVPYVMEEFITGDICSYDAIVNAESEPLFESMTVWPPSVMDIVLQQLDLSYYTAAELPEALRRAGRATVKAFGVRSRFVHLEFFRLTKAKPGLGEVGDFVGLEVNMRPAGGYTPDMMNFAHSTDVYQIWADMVTFGERRVPAAEREYFCVYASQKDSRRPYEHSHEEILARYGNAIVMCERMPELMVRTMGNQMYTAKFDTLEEVEAFRNFVLERK